MNIQKHIADNIPIYRAKKIDIDSFEELKQLKKEHSVMRWGLILQTKI